MKILIPILIALLVMGCASGKTLLVHGAASITGNANSDLVVVTFNVQDLYFAGKDRNRRMELIGQALATLNPDVVGIQEAFIGKDRAVLQKQLKDSRLQNYAYFDYGKVNSGLLILSAFRTTPMPAWGSRGFGDLAFARRSTMSHTLRLCHVSPLRARVCVCCVSVSVFCSASFM